MAELSQEHKIIFKGEIAMFKKVLALLMVGAMSLSLVACSGGGTTSSTAEASKDESKAESTESTTESTAESTESKEAGGTAGGAGELTVWCWDPAFNLFAMEEAAKVYQKTNPDFKLNIVETPWDDIQTQLITAASSGDTSSLPDIFLTQNNAFQKNVINYPTLFTDMTDSGIKFDEFGASSIAYSTIEGKNYGVPFDNGASVFALRTDLLAEAGYTLKDFTDITWDECIEKGKVVKEKTGKPLFSFTSGGADMVLMMIQSAGESLFTAEGEANIAGNEAVKVAMETYKKLVTEGVVLEVNGWDEYVASFVNGNVAGTLNGCWILGSVKTAEDQSGKWGVTNIPKLVGVNNATNYTANGGSSWAVSANAKNKDLAVDFLKNTFAGSVEFYENILSAGALANWTPAGESTKYAEKIEYFGGQAIYADIVDYASKVPSNYTGVFYYEAQGAMTTAVTNVILGNQTVEDAIKAAQEETEFNMN